MYHFFKPKKIRDITRGFTVVELLTSIGIMLIITSAVLFNQSTYTAGAALASSADSISSTLFQAQVYGVSVKEASTGSNDFSSLFGVSFNRVDLYTGNITNQNYILFTDKVLKNQSYDYVNWWGDCSSGSECIENNLMPGQNYIKTFCILRSNAAELCGTVNRVDVMFKRPNLEAIMKFYNLGGNPVIMSNVIGVRIEISYPNGPSKSVVVYNTGQISVQ
jgi:type II secretory pathway pseudopilin PulG